MDFLNNVIKLYVDRKEFFLDLCIQHIVISGIAILIITIIGISVGIMMTRYRILSRIILALTSFLYTIPSIALFGFLVAITGIGRKSAIIVLVLYGILPIIRNTYVGITEVDSQVMDSAVAMGSTDLQLLYRIQLPLAIPFIIAGFRTMVIMIIALAGIASFIGAGGLGVAIWRGISTNYPEMTFAGSLLVALLAFISDLFIGMIEKKIEIKVSGKLRRS